MGLKYFIRMDAWSNCKGIILPPSPFVQLERKGKEEQSTVVHYSIDLKYIVIL